jgi:hypothetical protein
MRIAAILLATLWLSGCFIADELRKGDALIDQHSVGWREKRKSMAEDEAAAAQSEAVTQSAIVKNAGPGVKGKLADWWQETVEEEPVKSRSSDKLVSCNIGGKVKFVRQSDCDLQRGQAKQLKSKAKSAGATTPKSKPGV